MKAYFESLSPYQCLPPYQSEVLVTSGWISRGAKGTTDSDGTRRCWFSRDADQRDIDGVSPGFAFGQYTVDRIRGIAGRHFDFDAEFFRERIHDRAILARWRAAGSYTEGAFLLCRGDELGPFLFEIRGGLGRGGAEGRWRYE